MAVSDAIRQHYVPRFLQRRFGCDPSDKKTPIVRLDKRTGGCRTGSPTNEAVRRYYYRLENEEGEIEDGVEKLLSRIEDRAAPIIARIVEQSARVPGPEDIVSLSTFVATMAHRTPDARADLATADVEIAKLMAERALSDPDAIQRALGPQATDEEIAAMQRRVLDDLREDRIEFESTPTREVGFMLAGMPPVTEWLISKAAWHVLVAPPERQFVLSDAPVAHYDPTPKVPDAGASFESSPNSMTVFAIDPRLALLIRPAADQLLDWRMREVDKRIVDDINLLIYAQADEAIFGSSQAIITGVRRDAKQSPKRVGEYRRRRPRIWATEIASKDRPGDGGVRRFTSINRDGRATRAFYVDPAAEREAQRRAI
jgi:hypothetical protein